MQNNMEQYLAKKDTMAKKFLIMFVA